MTARIALASLFIVPAAMAYPWSSTEHRWLLGVAVAVVVVLFAWWRGSFVTTVVGRRLAMWRRRTHRNGARQSSLYTTVLLKVDGPGPLPLPLIASYLYRYGIRCDKIRITSRDFDGARTTWVSLTLGAADNLAALRARSPRIPLHDTAEVVGRRLADHLRETGWTVGLVDDAEAPMRPDAKETWRGLRDASGYVAAYRVPVEDGFDEVWAVPSSEIWTALEFTGTAVDLGTAAACAIRTDDRPVTIAGVTPLNGRHRQVLDALSPLSAQRLAALTRT
jgi:type VII secretion protein EccE